MPSHFGGRPSLGTSHACCCQGLAFQVHIARQEEEAWQGTFSYSGSLRSIKEALGPKRRHVPRYLWLLLQSPQELLDAICPPGLPEEHWPGTESMLLGGLEQRATHELALLTGRASTSVKWE